MYPHSIYKETDQRIGIFVDVQNMFYSAKSQYQSKIDYSKLLERICQGRRLIRSIAYVVQKPNVDQSSFLEALKRSGYEVKSKQLVIRDDGSSKADWNMGIALDALSLAKKLDTVVLVSGDGDFVPLVHMLNDWGCRTEVVSFQECTSNDLIRACDQFVDIDTSVLFREKKFSGEEEEGETERDQETVAEETEEVEPEAAGTADDVPEPFEGYPHRYDPDSL